jgi:(p)ppGpp synthase/HD superfamily hydrolase
MNGVFQQHGKDYAEADLAGILPRLGHKTLEDVLSLVGRGELPATEVLKTLYPDAVAVIEENPKRMAIKRSDGGWFNIRRVSGLKFRWPGNVPKMANKMNGGVPVRGAKELPIQFGASGAVPGDRIVGILQPGTGITIYPIHSPALKNYFDELDCWIDVTWDIDESSPQRFPAQIKVTAINEPGSLARIAGIIGETNGNIDKLQMMGRHADFTDMLIDVEVWDLKHLRDILANLRTLPVVGAAERVIM